MNSKKKIILGIVIAILLLNIVWTVMQNKLTPQFDAMKAEITAGIAALDQRITKLEQGGLPDVADLKSDFAALKEIAEKFAQRAGESLKTEEEQLATLEAQVAAQKAKVESLKKLAE